MNAVLGFLALHALFAIAGLSVLRATGLGPARFSAPAVLGAVGPAVLVGIAVVVCVQIVLLVLGVALTPVLTVVVAAAVTVVAGVVGTVVGDEADAPDRGRRRVVGAVAAVGGIYLLVGAWAMARLPTVLDDARIWSLRGLTLTYHHGLTPEIFANQGQSGAHPVYPLLQPALEALMFEIMGVAQLRLFHAELWLVLGAAVWTAGYLLAARTRSAPPVWLIPLALLALTPAVVENVAMGYADVTGSVLLAVGVLSLGLWLDGGRRGHLALAAILLGAAANAKDEELLATALVLVVAAVIAIVRRADRGRRLTALALAAVYVVVVVAPWRLWTRAHHLTDSVQPSLPRALSPGYVFGRGHQLQLTVTAMVHQVLAEWGWLAAIFVVAGVACLITRRARATACFYLAGTALIALSLVWLYTTTAVPLSFLIPTSMNRTVDVFMVLAALATAHLLSVLATGEHRGREVEPDG